MKDLWQTALNTQEQNSFAATCKPEDNLLLNGVFCGLKPQVRVMLLSLYIWIILFICTLTGGMEGLALVRLSEMVF